MVDLNGLIRHGAIIAFQETEPASLLRGLSEVRLEQVHVYFSNKKAGARGVIHHNVTQDASVDNYVIISRAALQFPK